MPGRAEWIGAREMRDERAARWWGRAPSPFAAGVAAITALAVAVRVGYVLVVRRGEPFGLDSVSYWLLGKNLATGRGYADPSALLAYIHTNKPTAGFPPLFPGVLAAFRVLGVGTARSGAVAAAVVACATVPLVAVLGRRLLGARVGLAAAAAVAVWPFLVASDGSLMSETLAVPLTTAAVLATVWAAERRSLRRWAVVGLLFGLSSLARSEAPVVAVCVVGVTLLAARGVPVRHRLAAATVAASVAVLVITPWAVYVVRDVGSSALLSSNSARTLAGANCPTTFRGSRIGLWDIACTPVVDDLRTDEEMAARLGRKQAQRYVSRHVFRVPLVVGVRVARTFGLYAPRQQRDFEVVESRDRTWQWFAWWSYLAVLPVAATGLVLMIRRRVAVAPVLGVLLGVVAVSVVTYGNQRFRLVAEPEILLAAVAAVALWRRPVPGQVVATSPGAGMAVSGQR